MGRSCSLGSNSTPRTLRSKGSLGSARDPCHTNLLTPINMSAEEISGRSRMHGLLSERLAIRPFSYLHDVALMISRVLRCGVG